MISATKCAAGRTFETNLSNSQKEEMEAQKAYEDLKAAKENEIKAGNELKDKKTQELADTDAKLAQDKQDLEDTRNSLSADQKFLMNLKETCQMSDAEYEERVKSRSAGRIGICGLPLGIPLQRFSYEKHCFVSQGICTVRVSTRFEYLRVIVDMRLKLSGRRRSRRAARRLPS